MLLYYILAQSRARATAMISLSIRRTALGLPKAIVSGNEEGGESSLSFTMCIIYIRFIHITRTIALQLYGIVIILDIMYICIYTVMNAIIRIVKY